MVDWQSENKTIIVFDINVYKLCLHDACVTKYLIGLISLILSQIHQKYMRMCSMCELPYHSSGRVVFVQIVNFSRRLTEQLTQLIFH